jgi:hypothetical protein
MKRWPLFVAVGYVVFLFAGLVLLPAAPEVTASGARIVRYYQDHGDAVRVANWLSAWSMVPLVLLVAHLRSRLAGTSRDVMLLGAAGLVVTTIVWSWFNLGLALHPDTLDPQVARTLTDVSAYFGPVLTVSIVLLIAPVGLAAWRREGGFPRWLAWLTAVFAAEQSIETITVFGKRGFIAPGGAMNFALGAGLFLVWIIGAGIAASQAAETSTSVSPLAST